MWRALPADPSYAHKSASANLGLDTQIVRNDQHQETLALSEETL